MLPSSCQGGTPNCACVTRVRVLVYIYEASTCMPVYDVDLRRIEHPNFATQQTGDVFSTCFPNRDAKINDTHDLLNKFNRALWSQNIRLKLLELITENDKNHVQHLYDLQPVRDEFPPDEYDRVVSMIAQKKVEHEKRFQELSKDLKNLQNMTDEFDRTPGMFDSICGYAMQKIHESVKPPTIYEGWKMAMEGYKFYKTELKQ